MQFRKRSIQARLQIHESRYCQRTKHQEQALREGEQRSLLILEDIEEGYFETDLVGNLVFFNESLCRISGYSNDGLLGMNNREFTDSETTKRMYKAFSEVYRTGKPIKLKELQIIRKDGTKLTLEISASLMRDSEGHPTGFRGIARDVTARRETEEAVKETEKRYRSLFEESLDAIVITDRKGKFVDANKAALSLFGLSREETSRTSFEELYINPRDGARLKQEIETKGFLQGFEANLKK